MENFTWGPNNDRRRLAPFVAGRDPFVMFSGVAAAVGCVVAGGGTFGYFRDHMTWKICYSVQLHIEITFYNYKDAEHPQFIICWMDLVSTYKMTICLMFDALLQNKTLKLTSEDFAAQFVDDLPFRLSIQMDRASASDTSVNRPFRPCVYLESESAFPL